jgi:hypothetical protein
LWGYECIDDGAIKLLVRPMDALTSYISSILLWKLAQTYHKYKHFEIAYWAERKGRIRVEQEMRNMYL